VTSQHVIFQSCLVTIKSTYLHLDRRITLVLCLDRCMDAVPVFFNLRIYKVRRH
jgi:hypothetical protein